MSATVQAKPRARSLAERRLPLAVASAQIDQLGAVSIGEEFEQSLERAGLLPLRPTTIDVFQINVGKVCNQTCRHCHVDAGPDRTESMSLETAELCMSVLEKTAIPTVDITGGAPEMNPHFRYLVERSHALGRHVIDRCNLTILETKSYRDLPEFFAKNEVEVVCSLPHYAKLSTDKQRGDGVFDKSLRALRRLNEAGYGQGDPKRKLVLVTNPVGAFLPGNQDSLEREWKRELAARFELTFDSLFCITNLPISRYLEWLIESDNLGDYMGELVRAFNPVAAAQVMCRNTISVGWDGGLFDCDFNQMLELGVSSGAPQHLADFDLEALTARDIVVGRHCFGCTAGAGSSCGGSVT